MVAEAAGAAVTGRCMGRIRKCDWSDGGVPRRSSSEDGSLAVRYSNGGRDDSDRYTVAPDAPVLELGVVTRDGRSGTRLR